jgi:hypothetical protein
MLERDPLDTKVTEAGCPGSKYLFLDCQFDLVLCGICIAGKSDVDREPIMLTPKSTVSPGQVLVKFDLLEAAAVRKHGAATLDMPK